MSTWRRHRTHRNNRASSTAPPGGEGWTIRDHRAILHSEPYASADLGAASDVTAKSMWSEAAPVSPTTALSPQLPSAVIAPAHRAAISWSATSVQVGRQRQAPGRGTGTTQSSSAPIPQIQFTRAVRRITALSQSRLHANDARRQGLEHGPWPSSSGASSGPCGRSAMDDEPMTATPRVMGPREPWGAVTPSHRLAAVEVGDSMYRPSGRPHPVRWPHLRHAA